MLVLDMIKVQSFACYRVRYPVSRCMKAAC